MDNKNLNAQNGREFKDIEKSLNYDQRRKLDLTLQVLNGSSNVYQEMKNVSDLFEGLHEVTNAYTNKDFKTSLKATKDCFEALNKIPDALNSLKNNDVNSFLIEPLMSNNHMFASLIRKINDDYSVTVINKGGRAPNRSQFEEFLVDKKIAPVLMHEISKIKGQLKTEDIYQIIENNSKEHYKLNVQSRNQKTGNCFIKEPQTAVKFAFSTKDMSQSQIEKLRDNSIKPPYSPKYNGPTEFTQYFLSGRFSKGDEKLHNVLSGEFNNYFMNKKFREFLNDGKDSERSLVSAFNVANAGPRSKELTESLKFINIDTLNQKAKDIGQIVKKINDVDLSERFITVNKYSTWEGRGRYFQSNINTPKLVNDLLNAEKSFPAATTQTRKELALGYFIEAVPHLINAHYSKAIPVLQDSNKLYAHNSRNYFLEGLCNSSMAAIAKKFHNKPSEQELHNTAINLFTHSIKLNPDFADAYAMRGYSYQELGDMEKANRDLQKAQELRSDIFEGLNKSDNKLDVYYHFTQKIIKDVLTQVTPFAVNPSLEKEVTKLLDKAENMDTIGKRKKIIANSKLDNLSTNSRKHEVDRIKDKMLNRKSYERSRAI